MNLHVDTSLRAKNLGKRYQANGKALVAAIVLHDTAGSGTHNDTRYLANPGDGRGVSVDFTVERDGSIYQLNPDLNKYCTFHAGRATYLKAAGRAFRNGAVNTVAVGIEIVQKANLSLSPLWPSEQIKAVADLCRFLCSLYDLDKTAITTHKAIITDGSRSDPRQFPFDSFWYYFGRTEGEDGAPVPILDPLNQPITYQVQAGDSLWKIARQFGTTIEYLKAINNLAEASNLIRPGQVLIVKK